MRIRLLPGERHGIPRPDGHRPQPLGDKSLTRQDKSPRCTTTQGPIGDQERALMTTSTQATASEGNAMTPFSTPHRPVAISLLHEGFLAAAVDGHIVGTAIQSHHSAPVGAVIGSSSGNEWIGWLVDVNGHREVIQTATAARDALVRLASAL